MPIFAHGVRDAKRLVLTPDDDDLVVVDTSATYSLISTATSMPEALHAVFLVRTDWLTGRVNHRDRVAVSVYLKRDRGGRLSVEPTVGWTRRWLKDAVDADVRRWRERTLYTRSETEARVAAEGLIAAVTASPEWLRVIEDGEAASLGDALAIAAQRSAA